MSKVAFILAGMICSVLIVFVIMYPQGYAPLWAKCVAAGIIAFIYGAHAIIVTHPAYNCKHGRKPYNEMKRKLRR